eukprot:CAMPEP_0169459026 /NCGR_PEP_ID=MMETSP1042-20121227/17745_1 /TAXON_ID=464988 /ORGANISM="Hemiselmis andersenii, Strain CCMP1180" /LENGTH=478 /DNA_ID=CAMNT_0009571445 /DNA_START=106 /DNA_END=1539 /DNA_ORIENTATION=-
MRASLPLLVAVSLCVFASATVSRLPHNSPPRRVISRSGNKRAADASAARLLLQPSTSKSVMHLRGGATSFSEQLAELTKTLTSTTDDVLSGSATLAALGFGHIPYTYGTASPSVSDPSSPSKSSSYPSTTELMAASPPPPEPEAWANSPTSIATTSAHRPEILTPPPSYNHVMASDVTMVPPAGASSVPLRVAFKRRAKVEYGDAVYVSGSCEALGDGDPSKAVRMKHGGGNVWTVTVDGVPMDARYRYLVQTDENSSKGKGKGAAAKVEPRWETEYMLPLTDTMHIGGDTHEQDDTLVPVRFVIKKQGAARVLVQGSLPELGSWNPKKALELDRVPGKDKWERIVHVPSDEIAKFEYKYVADDKVEKGSNRRSDANQVEPQVEGGISGRGVITLAAVWEGLLVRFLIFHPLEDPNSQMCISGSHPCMGEWLGKPLGMGLGNPRTLLTGVQGRCWEATFAAADADVPNVQYRYCIVTA